MGLMILYAGQQRRHRHKEQIFGLSGRGEGGMSLENTIETYTLPHVKQIVGICCMTQETQSLCSLTT